MSPTSATPPVGAPVDRLSLNHPPAAALASLVARCETFLSDYMAFTSPEQAFVVALWCVGTWVYRTFDAFPYLVITAATKQAGKTRLAELIGFLSCNAQPSTAMTPAVMFRMLDAFAGDDNPKAGVTIIYDEAETLSSEAQSVFRQVLNVGYRRGQTIMRLVKDTLKAFPVYCPKVFVLIGDVFDTLRDRSIIIELRRGIPRRLFDWTTAEADAKSIAADIQRTIGRFTFDASPVEFLTGREREVWAPLFSIARAANLDHRLVRAAADFSALKTAPKREITGERGRRILETEEARATEQTMAERALRDLATVMHADDRAVRPSFKLSTETAVELMKAIDTAPWRTYRGVGLDARTLAGMVRRFGLSPDVLKIDGRSVRGYRADAVRVALDKLGNGNEVK